MLCCGGDCGYASVQDDEMIFSAHTNLVKPHGGLSPKDIGAISPDF
jgi:hypothetical protein